MLAEGQDIGSYRVVRELGRGGMGAVYEAVHKQLGKKAAIKVLHAHFSHDPQQASRFFNEARAVSIVDHPGLIDVFEFGHLDDGATFIVMELLKGESLRARLDRQAAPMGDEALRLARQIASAVSAAHEQGIVHRDLKPDNVFIVPDPEAPGGERAKILDFGIAKMAAPNLSDPSAVSDPGTTPAYLKTQAGALLGTPAYMAPEQCRGAEEVDDKADVYSLGVMLYQMLSGRLPFTGTAMGELMAMHLLKEPPPLKEVQPGVPEALARLVHAMLQKDKTGRPPMAQVVAELGHLEAARATAPGLSPFSGSFASALHGLSASGNSGKNRSSPGPAADGESPHLQRWGVIAGVLAAACLVVAGLSLRRHPQEAPPRRGPRAVDTGAPRDLLDRPPGAQRAADPPGRRRPPDDRPARVHLTLRSNPPGADVVRLSDSKLLGRTPWEAEQDGGTGLLKVELRKEGFFPKPVSLELSEDAQRDEVLVPKSDDQVQILN